MIAIAQRDTDNTKLSQYCLSHTNTLVYYIICLLYTSTSLVQHRINTGDTTPIRQPPRRPPLSKQEEMSRLVQDMLTEGVIEPSSSAWSSPVAVSYTHLDVYKRQRELYNYHVCVCVFVCVFT